MKTESRNNRLSTVADSEELSRRSFFGRAVATAATATSITACVDDGEPSSSRTAVATLDELAAGPVEFELPGVGPCFAAELGEPVEDGQGPDSSIVAFSSLCPHMGCPIELAAVDAATGRFGPCRCHHSLFDLRRKGTMVRGRASTNLARIELEVVGDTVYATGTTHGLAFGAPLTVATAVTTPDDVEGDR